MDYEQFLEYVAKDLQNRIPDINVQILDVNKLQGESYRGISVSPEGSNAGVTMDLLSRFQMLQDNMLPLKTIIMDIEESVTNAMDKIPRVDPMMLQDYDQMKRTLVMQAVPIEPNRALLDTLPHKALEDMAIVYRFHPLSCL